MADDPAAQDASRPSLWRRPGVWVLLLLPVHALILRGLAAVPAFVEATYGRAYPLLAWARTWLDPLPLAPIVLIAAGLLLGLGWRARRRAGSRRVAVLGFGWRVLVAAAVLGHLFPLAWGLNYLRPSAAERLGLELEGTEAAFKETAGRVVAATNAARVPIEGLVGRELERAIDAEVRRALAELELDEAAFPRRTRYLPAGTMMMGGWHGVTIPWTVEALVDPAVDPRYLPHTIAHEKAHQAGFAREADANFVAWLALCRAEDPRLRYSSLFYVVDLFLEASPVGVSDEVLADMGLAREVQRQAEVPVVAAATHQVYDGYLKANRVEAGLDDYDRVAVLIHAWLREHPDFLER